MDESHLLPLRRKTNAMTGRLFEVIGLPFEQTSELQRQLLSVFAFGMAFAKGQEHQLSALELHALTIAFLLDIFHYSREQAVAFAEDLIAAAADKDRHPTMNAIIHRGIDDHLQWQQGETDQLRANVQEIFQAVRPLGRQRNDSG